MGDADEAVAAFCTYVHTIDNYKAAKATTEAINKAYKSGGVLSDEYMILDTAAQRSMICNPALAVGVWEARRPARVEGISRDGEPVLVTKECMTMWGKALLSADLSANVISFAELVDTCAHVEYVKEQDWFAVRVTEHDRMQLFTRNRKLGLYIYDQAASEAWAEIEWGADTHVEALVTTVEDQMKKYTRREIDMAEEAKELQRRFFFVSRQALEAMLRRGKIANTRVTVQDLARSYDIWGRTLGELKGKSTYRRTPTISPIGERLRTQQPKFQQLHVDLFYVNDIAYMVSVLEPCAYVQVTKPKNKREWTLWRHLERHMKFCERFGLVVERVRVDGESAMGTDWFAARVGPEKMDIASPGTHVPIVERMIRTLKERVRAVICTLPFRLTVLLEEWAVRAAAFTINLTPTRNSFEFASPREKLFGTLLDAAVELRHGFGDYVQIHHEDINNSMNERTSGALALAPTGALDGSWWYYSMTTTRVVRRRRATALPMPQDVIDAIERAAAKRRRGLHEEPTFKHAWQVDDLGLVQQEQDNEWFEGDILDFNGQQGEYVIPQPIYDDDHQEVGPEEDLDDDQSAVSDRDLLGQDDDEPAGGQADMDPLGDIRDIVGDDDEDAEPAEPAQEVPAEAPAADEPQEYGRGVRARAHIPGKYYQMQNQPAIRLERLPAAGSRRRQPIRARALASRVYIPKTVYGFRLSVNAAIKRFGHEAVRSVASEVRQIVDGGVIESVDSSEFGYQEWTNVIGSLLFLKEKYSALGEFVKLKARLVADGSQQDRSVYAKDASSPTVATQTVFMVAAIAQMEGRAVAAVDVPGAFLKSDMPDDGSAPVLVKLDKFVTQVLVELDPSYGKHVRKDGTCIVRLKKALYGTIQAARAWYKRLRGDLESLGFQANPYDNCCFNRTESDGRQTTIVVHVDDMLITASSEATLDMLISDFGARYNDEYAAITVQRGKRIEYIGMVFDFNPLGTAVQVTMDGYVEDLLNEYDSIAGEADTPATATLFSVREDAEKLDKKRAEEFHALVAKVLYLAKRVRPDLLVSVSFLTRRVQNPDTDDQRKLERLIKYIRATKHLGIRLSADKCLAVMAYIDASFAPHTDMKSHTGAMITLGRGPYFTKSSVQKINTLSSSEAELVGLSEGMGQVLWTRNFLEAQGYKMGPAKVFEDNQSTIKLAENGESRSARTRHIAIRYFFIADRIKSGEISIEYLNTGDMIADILTKPLTGELFKKLRALLLNWE